MLQPPPPNPLPSWYNPNAHFEFHEGAAGHDLEGCFALKARVQDLVMANILTFKDVGPNVRLTCFQPMKDLQLIRLRNK